MSAMWWVARNGFLRGARNRRLQITAIGLPILVMLVVGLLFGSGGRRLPVGVVSDRSGPLGADLEAQLRRDPRLKVRVYHHAASVRGDVRRGRIVGGLLVPEGFDQTVRRGGDGAVTIIEQPGRPEGIAARAAISVNVAYQSAVVTGARLAASRAGVPLDAALDQGERFLRSRSSFRSSAQSAFAYTAPSNLVLFVFITGLLTSVVFVLDRQLGMTRRMLATPAPPWAIVGGRALGTLLVVLVQGLVLLAVGGILFGVHWGDPLGVAALVTGVAATATACGVLLGSVARTPEQAVSIAVPAGIAMGMLGGCMWSLEIVGPGMRALGHFVPQAWAMDGFVRLVFGRRSVVDIAPQLLVLLLFAVVLCGLAANRLRRSITAAS